MVELGSRLGAVVGDRTAKALDSAFGLRTVHDLVRHYPRRYVDVATPDSLSDLVVGQYSTFVARVVSVKNFKFGPGGRKTRTQVVITDGHSEISVTFFQQPWLSKNLQIGSVHLFAGEVTAYNGQIQLTNPVMQPMAGGESSTTSSDMSRAVMPIYRASKKIATWEIEKAIAVALDVLEAIPDPIPLDVRMRHDLVDATTALRWIHQPEDTSQWVQARRRFTFEEALVLQVVFALRRRRNAARLAVARPRVSAQLRDRFEENLPFQLTAGQAAVLEEVTSDLGSPNAMHRLLQGEVGSGKTIVALIAMLQVVDAGGQAALLAPTEVLAVQHYQSLTRQLGELATAGTLSAPEVATKVSLLTGSLSAAERQRTMLDIVSGRSGIVVGTHALLQESVHFAELGLVVIDEQHRFGVEQRAALVDRAEVTPHMLVMTATPIPRTVAMTVFGDLETSTLKELPAGRQQIQTTVIALDEHPHWLDRAWQRVREEVADGRQVYVVTSRIGDDEPELLDSLSAGPEHAPGRTTSVREAYEQLSSGPLKDLSLAVLHGRLKNDEKDRTMAQFASGEVDVLIATTVVEVGVDVPNATMMIILDADRFGMSQLHQLRGRVGRGSLPGLCLLVTSSEPDTVSRERLAAVASTNDGFQLAAQDVELRREGDILGARQSGFTSSLRLLSVVKHEKIIGQAREDAIRIIESDPELSETPALLVEVSKLEASQQAEFLERT